MPKNISTLVTGLLKRANIDVTDPRYLDLVNITGQIGDEAYSEVEGAINRLLTLDEARNHADLRRHFRQNVLDPVDKELERWFEDMGIEDADKAEVLADKNTYVKLRKALEKTQQLESKRAGSKKAEESKKIAEELTAAKRTLEEMQGRLAQQATELERKGDERVADYALYTRLSSLDYANEQMSKAEAVMGFRPLLENELRARGARYVLNPQTQDLELIKTDTGEPLLENNQPIRFSDFVSSFAAAKRVLKINSDAATANQQHITYPTLIPVGRDLPRSNQNALSIIESKLKGG
jgi:hypothetical protein